MEQAFFLVTSLAGLKKLTFQQKIKALLEEHVQITALLAIVQFDEYEIARQTLQAMIKPEQAAQFEIRTMAELVANTPGVALRAEDRFNDDFETLPSKQFATQTIANGTIHRYIDAGEIVAETVTDATQTPLMKTRLVDNQPVQSVVYEDQRPAGMMTYQDGVIEQAMLLNAQGELVYRFIRHQHPVTYAYDMGRTSKLVFTNLLSETDDQKHVVYQATEDRADYEVIDHVGYHRFSDAYEFYAQLLQTTVPEGAEIFIDLNDNPKLVEHLPQQLIFNY